MDTSLDWLDRLAQDPQAVTSYREWLAKRIDTARSAAVDALSKHDVDKAVTHAATAKVYEHQAGLLRDALARSDRAA